MTIAMTMRSDDQQPDGLFQLPDDRSTNRDDDEAHDIINNNDDDYESTIEAQWEHPSSRHQKNNDRCMFLFAYLILLLSLTGLAVASAMYVKASLNSTSNGSNNVTESSSGSDSRYPEYRADLESALESISTYSAFLENSSPQVRALDWLASEDRILVKEDLSREDPYALYQRYVLMVLFFATNGELWEGTPWTELSDVHECDFPGIDCDRNGQIVGIDRSFGKLRGRLPDEMGSLTQLTSVNFNANNLEGTIPEFFHQQLTNLVYLDLSANGFTSTLSPDFDNLSSSLRDLILDQVVGLTGTIPESFTSLSLLRTLQLANTRLTGQVFDVAVHLPSLEVLDVRQSLLTGTIPTTTGLLTNMKTLVLIDCNINMTNIPSEIGLLTKLVEFGLYSAEIDGGPLPTELGNLESILFLSIRGSDFTGTIPTEYGRLTKLQGLTLEGGQLVGTIPSEIGLLTRLTALSVFRNKLVGTIPTEIGNIKGLKELFVQYNDLSGAIPSGVCNDDILIERDCEITVCACCNSVCVGS